MQKNFNGILLVPFFILSLTLSAQVNSISPYTKLGLGDFSSKDYARSQGFGGATLGLYDPLNINFSNPASYSALSLTTFEIGFQASAFELQQKSPDIIQTNYNAGLRYFSFGLPVFQKWWGSAIGLQPYSFKGYNISIDRTFQDTINVTDEFNGTGGLNQFFWGNSFEVAKGLSLGVNAAFVFGKIEENSYTYWNDARFLNSKNQEVVRVKGVYFNFGGQYHITDSIGRALGIGLTYSNSSKVNADVGDFTYIFRDNFGRETPLDSLSSSGETDSKITLPGSFGIGLTYGKYVAAAYRNAWLMSADFEVYNTGDFVYHDGNAPLVNSYRAEIGGLVIPGLAFEKLERKNSLLAKMEYRLGGFYEKTPYQLGGNTVNNYGITFGLGIPVRDKNLYFGELRYSTINMGLVLGRRGTTENGLIQETYLNFYLGITLNDRWFIEQKYR